MTQALVTVSAADTPIGPPGENEDDRLDEALQETFPASDPISTISRTPLTPSPASGEVAHEVEPPGVPVGGCLDPHQQAVAIDPIARVALLAGEEQLGGEDRLTGRRHVIRETMQTLEQGLDPERLLRVHRSAIVRLDLVESLERGQGGASEMLLRNGVRLRVSRSRREALERWLGRTS